MYVQVVRIEYKQWIKDKQMKLIAEEKALDTARDKLIYEVGARARARLFGSSPTPHPQSVPGDTMTQRNLPLPNQSVPIIRSEQHQNGGLRGTSFPQTMSHLEQCDATSASGVEQQYGGMTFPTYVPVSTLPLLSSQSVRSVQSTDNESNLISSRSSSSSSSATSNSSHNTVRASTVSTSNDTVTSSNAFLGTETGTTGSTGTTGCSGLMGLSDDVYMAETVISPASSAPTPTSTSTSTAAIIDRSTVEVMEEVSSISDLVPTPFPPPGAPVPTPFPRPVHAPEGHNDGREQELNLESLVMTPTSTSTSEHIITATKSINSHQIDPPTEILISSLSAQAQDSKIHHNEEKENDILIEIDEAGDEYLSSLNYSFVSFISYPFVLSSSSKAGVLECDATQQMRRGKVTIDLMQNYTNKVDLKLDKYT